MDDRRFETWVTNLKTNLPHAGSSVDQTIEKLIAAGPAGVRYLGRIDDSRVEEFLVRVLWNPDPDPDRQYAKLGVVRALAASPSPWVQRALVRALGYPKASLTRIVVQTLGGIGDEKAIGPLKDFEDANAGEPFGLADEATRAIAQIEARLATGVSPAAAKPEEPPGERSEIDVLIDQAGSWDEAKWEAAVQALEALGEPALRRLFEATEYLVKFSSDRHSRDAGTRRALALGRLGRLRPDVLVDLVRGKKYLKLDTIQGLGYTGDQRLAAIAREALKIVGNDG
jgi:HEAT repeat protein